MKIVIFGGTGYIGSEFINQLKARGNQDWVRLSSRTFDREQYSYEGLTSLLNKFKPTVIINCAAYVGGLSVANCEDKKDETFLANVRFPTMLGEYCKKTGTLLAHISTGCLFKGYPEGGYTEMDAPNMTFQTECCFYTGTKVVAEQALESLDKKYIWRIRLPFDNINHPRNYLTKIMSFDKLIIACNSLSNRQELVNACLECIFKELPFGTYHVTNPGGISTVEIAEKINGILKLKKHFKYFESDEALEKISKIPRSNTILNVDKLASFGIKLKPVEESVEDALKNWKA